MFSGHQSFIYAQTLALWIAVVAVMAGCGGGSSQMTSGQGNISVSVIGLLSGTSVVLQNNGGNNLTISANGTASFNGAYTIGLPYSITVSTQPANETCTVTSNSSGVIPNAAVLVAVTCIPSAGIGTLQTAPQVTGINAIPITLDAGPSITTRQINVPYVSVTVCPHGLSGSVCQTIDHIQLDTGSSGLRLLNSSLYSNLNLTAVNSANNGQAIGECMPFGVGVTWGSVVLADIYLGGEVASNVPIQNIGAQPGGVTAVPADCSNTGAIQITQDALGANGILGVGLFINDCDQCLNLPIIPAAYYTCNPTGCTNINVTQQQVVQNPVASLPTNNNGVVIQLPAVGSSGASTLGGFLYLGIDTNAANNFLGTASVYATDASGYFTTIYKNVSTSVSFVDSGSNALFFDDTSIPLCTVNTWAYCPSSPLALSAITTTTATGSPYNTMPFSIVGVDQIVQTGMVAANIGGPAGGYFDWGLPFFFGRKVFTAISTRPTPGTSYSGPYFAY